MTSELLSRPLFRALLRMRESGALWRINWTHWTYQGCGATRGPRGPRHEWTCHIATVQQLEDLGLCERLTRDAAAAFGYPKRDVVMITEAGARALERQGVESLRRAVERRGPPPEPESAGP